VFNISQSARDLALLDELKIFFNNLWNSEGEGYTNNSNSSKSENNSVAYIYEQKGKNTYFLTITDTRYIKNILIPLFDSTPVGVVKKN
jgi:hypothetical protein